MQTVKLTTVSAGPFYGNPCPGKIIGGLCTVSGQFVADKKPLYRGDPINMNNHSVSDSREDFTFPINFSRVYDTLNTDIGILGLSWTSNFDKTVSIPTSLAQGDNDIVFTATTVDSNGNSVVAPLVLANALMLDVKDGLDGHIYFQLNDTNSPWTIPVGHFVGYSLFTDTNNNVLIFTKPDGTVETFDLASGFILNERFANGSYFNYSYTNGLLSQVTNNFGQWLQFSYSNVANVVTQINASNGDYLQYTYLGGIVVQASFNGIETVGYNFQGNFLTDKTDENGVTYTHFSYDANGNAISNYLIVGNTQVNRFDFVYNNDGSINETQPNGANRTHYMGIVNGTNRYQGTYNISGGNGYYAESNISYDNFGNMTSQSDSMGRTTTYSYDGNNYLRSETSPNGATTAYNWDENNNLLMSKNESSANGSRTTNYSYDSNRNLIGKTVSGAGGTMTWSYSWTADGRIASKTLPNGNTVSYSYYPINGSNVSGLVQSISTSGGLTVTVNSYDNRGNATSVTDSNGITKTMTYDMRGRLLTESVGNVGNSYSYDMVGNLLSSSFANGYNLSMTYDTAHRLTNISDNMGGNEAITVDNTTGTMTNVSISQGSNLVRMHNQIVNVLGQVTKTYNANPNNAYSKSLLKDGSLNSGSDPIGNSLYRRVDNVGRTSSYSDGNDNYGYSYDTDNNVNSITVNNQTTGYNYDDFGRLTELISPDTGTRTIEYNISSGTTKTVDAKGITHILVKDLNGNTVSISHSGNGNSTTESFSYDGAGRLNTMTDSSGSTAYSYNGLSLLSNKNVNINGKTFGVQYSYDGAGQLTGITYPSGLTVSYSYTNGFLTGVNAGGNQVVSNVSYNSLLKEATGWTVGNSNVQVSRNADGALTGFVDGGLMNQTMTVDGTNQISTVHDSSYPNQYASGQFYGNHTLSYWETNTGYGNLRYYANSNSNWNMSNFNGYLGNIVWGLNGSNNQLLNFTNRSGQTFSYSYDANGNMTSDELGSYTYDLKNNMISSTRLVNNTNMTGYYMFNGLNQRVAKAVNNTMTYFVYNESSQLIGEYDGNGNPIAEYVYFGLRPVAVRTNGQIYTVHTDYLGTPRLIADGSNNTVWKWDNGDVFGNNLASGNITFNLRFAGQYFDFESNFHYNISRTYNPATGRYMQSDPLGLLAGSNTYNYVGRNPMNGVDPLGLWSKQGDPADINLFGTGGSVNMHALASSINLSPALLNYLNGNELFIVSGHANGSYFENDIVCPPDLNNCGAYDSSHLNNYSNNSFNFSNDLNYSNMQNINDFIKLLNNYGFKNNKPIFLAGCNSSELAKKLSLKVSVPVMGVEGELMYSKNKIYGQWEVSDANPYDVYLNGELIDSFGKTNHLNK